MRIAFVNPPLHQAAPPHLTSVGLWSWQVGHRLARRDHDVIIYGSAHDRRGRSEVRDGVMLRHIPLGGVSKRAVGLLQRLAPLRPANRPVFASSGYYHGYLSGVARDAARRGIDMLHVHDFSQFIPILRHHLREARIALHEHNSHSWLNAIDARMARARVAAADLLLGCSDHVCTRLRQAFPDAGAKCRAAYNGVDPEHWLPAPSPAPRRTDAPRLLFVGRLSPEKGVHFLVEAFARLLPRYPKARMDLIGPQRQIPREFLAPFHEDRWLNHLLSFYRDDPVKGYVRYLQQRLEELGINDRVALLGEVPHEETVRHYQQAHVVVNPALRESFGRSLIESMSCEVPVVATDVGGMPDIVANRALGRIAPAGDPDALADAIDDVLADPHARQEMGSQGRRHVLSRYSWEAVVEQVLRHYGGALNAPSVAA